MQNRTGAFPSRKGSHSHRQLGPVDAIAEARSAGRRAGRQLRVKIITHQTDPSLRDHGKVVVLVVVNQDETDPDEEKRLEERARLLMNNAVEHLFKHSKE